MPKRVKTVVTNVAASKGKRKGGSARPPQKLGAASVDMVYRFRNGTTATATDITVNDLLDLVCVGTGAATGSRLMDSVRVVSIEIWGIANPAASADNTIKLTIGTGATVGLGGSGKKYEDTCVDSMHAPHLFWRPSKKDQVGMYQCASSTARMFFIDVPPGTTVDLHCVWSMREAVSATAVSTALSGATAGVTYVRALNSTSATAQWLIPTGVATA